MKKSCQSSLFHHTLASGHPLLTSWRPTIVAYFGTSGDVVNCYPENLKRLCCLTNENDVAHAIVRCIDGPLRIRAVFKTGMRGSEKIAMYAKDEDGNKY